MGQELKNLGSITTADEMDMSNLALGQENNNQKTKNIMCTLVSTEEWCKFYSYQTGKFAITSSRGHKYIFVFYHYDTNTIQGIAIKSCNTTDICQAWKTAYEQLKAYGETPNIHILDNKCSQDTKNMFKEAHVEYQLVPQHIHQRNATEQAIITYKNHLIAVLYACDPKFSSREWDRLLLQCNITLNLLRSAKHNLSLYVYASLLDNFDFNKTPMTPPGTKTVACDESNNRLSWAVYGTEAWYIFPSMEHYPCLKCYMPVTCRERDADTIFFF